MAAQRSRKPKRAKKKPTAQKTAAMANIQAVTAAEAKFRGLLEAAPDPIVISDEKGNIVLVNAQTEKVLGYSRDELLGKPVEILIPEKLRGAHVGHREKYYGDLRTRPMGMGSWYDLYACRKDGTMIPVDIALAPVRTDGQLLVMAIIRDITEQKRAEKEIRLNLERVQVLKEIDNAISSSLDLKEILDILLEKLALLLPYPTAPTVSLRNRETGQFEPTACWNMDEEAWKAHFLESGRGIGYTKIAVESRTPAVSLNLQTDPNTRHPDFVRRHGLASYLVIPLIAKEAPVGVLGIFTKEEHEFTKDEVEFLQTLAGQAAVAIDNAQLYEEMAKLASDLSQSNRVKDEFLSVMSHELRTPLNVVMGYAGLLREGVLGDTSPQQKDAIEKILHRANDQLAMVTNILQATVFETEEVRVESHEVSLEDLLNQLKQAFQAPANKPLELKWDYPPDLLIIKTDSGKLKQILQNIIDNAIKFTEQGSVTISARIIEGGRQQAVGVRKERSEATEDLTNAYCLVPNASRLVEFKVADTGVGIVKEHLPVIFEKFRQVDSSETRLYCGVGLGLYIVKKLTELLGGTVDVESEPGKGSTFTVVLPL